MISLYNSLTGLYRVLGASCVIATLAVLLAAIVLRELFATALVWGNEVSIALFVWSVFIGAGLAFAENAHIRFSIAIEQLPLTGRRVVGLLVSYGGLVLLAGFLASSVYVTWVYRDQRFTTLTASAAWQWAAVPFGSLLALLGWIRFGKWSWSGKELGAKAGTGIPGT
ncbi:MAG: TRAP transporter small permease subunit [Vicinamibacterales bacterium]